MTVELPDELATWVESLITSGRFETPDDVIRAALSDMRDVKSSGAARVSVETGQAVPPEEAVPHRSRDLLSEMPIERLNSLIEEGVRDLNEGRLYTAEQVDVMMAEHRAAFLARRAER